MPLRAMLSALAAATLSSFACSLMRINDPVKGVTPIHVHVMGAQPPAFINTLDSDWASAGISKASPARKRSMAIPLCAAATAAIAFSCSDVRDLGALYFSSANCASAARSFAFAISRCSDSAVALACSAPSLARAASAVALAVSASFLLIRSFEYRSLIPPVQITPIVPQSTAPAPSTSKTLDAPNNQSAAF